MKDFHFLRPIWFLAVPLLCALVWWAIRGRARGGVWSQICDAALLPFVMANDASDLKSRAGWLLTAAGALAIIALAGPVWERLPVPVFRGEAALVIALDLSASMNAADIKPSRLARAKFKVADILRARKTGQTALLVFAAQSFVVTPLTDDGQTLSAQLQALDTSIMPSQGSEPAAALTLAGKLLQQAGMPNGHVLLITDGADPGPLERATKVAASASFRLSVLGLGTLDGAPIPDASGGFAKGQNGALVISHLDGAALQSLAKAGKGVYLEARADDEDVTTLARYLADDRAAHAQRLENLAASQWHEFGPWLLLPLLPLAALAFRRGLLVLLLAVALTGLAPQPAQAGWWQTPDQAGQTAFKDKDYAGAAREFLNPAWRAAARYRAGDFAGAAADLKPDDSALAHYNRGNALARAGHLQDALAAYSEALKHAPEDADAQYNKALIEKLLESKQHQQNPQKQQPGQSQDKKQKSDNERSEQQFDGDQGGSADDGTSNASNAAGGARSKDQRHSDQPKDSAQAKGAAREKINPATEEAAKDEQAQSQAEASSPKTQSEIERAQATEQWLRQIPDDPAGLLRRKFEYQYKQIYGDTPYEGNQW